MSPPNPQQPQPSRAQNAGAAGADLEGTFVPSATPEGQEGLEETKLPAQPRAAAPSGAAASSARTQLGDFRLIKKLGQGGMGEVFLAHQISLDRPAALKVLAKHLADKPDFVKRFYREARAMAKVDHPNAVRVYAVDEADGVHYVAMELIDGKSMQDWLDKLGKLSVGDALHVTLRCAEALQAAHAINLVHRDIKPDNIMLTSRGAVKVSDFGLAKALDDEDMSMTQSGTGLGTPYYMAPEQARNAKHVDGRCDVYALGVTLYHFLTGKLPFTGSSALEVIQAKELGKFTSPRRFNAEVPERLELILDKMLAKDPNHRFKDFGEVIKHLAALQLASPSLSFIEAKDKVVVATAAATAPTASAKPAATAPARAAVPPTSQADAARSQAAAVLPEGTWLVQFKTPEGKDTIVKWTTAQILQGLRSGTLDARAKGKKKAADSFAPLAQFPEFEAAVQGLVIKQRADKKASDMKAMYAQIDKQEKWRKTVRRLQGMFSGALGLVSLVVYLAVIAGVIVGGYYGYRYVSGQIAEKVNLKEKTAPGAPAPAP